MIEIDAQDLIGGNTHMPFICLIEDPAMTAEVAANQRNSIYRKRFDGFRIMQI